MQLSVEQVTSLAPDERSVAAGKKLARPAPWQALGHSERAIWGVCAGSAEYRVTIDLTDLATRCSCPSRKFPCKHALGLLLLAADAPASIPATAEPDWTAQWLDKRRASASGKKKPVDPVVRARTRERRERRVEDGLAQLDQWMEDLVRGGLASLEAGSDDILEQQARRLVDAQAPGLAARIRRLAGLVGAGPDWPQRVLDELGRLALLGHAYRRLDALAEPLRHDVRAAIGFTVDKDEVLRTGEAIADDWAVCGQRVVDDERLRTQRSWLYGVRSGRWALVLQFAVGQSAFAEPVASGTRFGATLRFYPGACPQRALIAGRDGPPAPLAGRLPGSPRIEDALETVSAALARQPWLERCAVGLHAVTPVRTTDGRFGLADASGAWLPLAGSVPLTLLALSGGGPLDVVGEWNGRRLLALGAWSDGQFVALTGRVEEQAGGAA